MTDEELIEWIEKNSGSFDQWMAIMRFGVAQFEQRPLLAIELIVREAERKRTNDPPNWCTADIARAIIERLKFKFLLQGGKP